MSTVHRVAIPEPFTLRLPRPDNPKPLELEFDFKRYVDGLILSDEGNRGWPNSDIALRVRKKVEALKKSTKHMIFDDDEKARLDSGLRSTKWAAPEIAIAFSEHGYPAAIVGAEECEVDVDGKLVPKKK